METIPEAVRIGQYMIRCPLVLERLKWDPERAELTYQARPKRSNGPSGGLERWDVLEFIARVTDHIPEPGQQLIRNWGFYSNASRGKRLNDSQLRSSAPASPDVNPQQPTPWHRQRRLSWAKMLQKVCEVDPLLCTLCGAEVKILSLITEFQTAKKILDCIGLPPQKPEPLAHSPPLFSDTVYVAL